jgi:hypothetical protein
MPEAPRLSLFDYKTPLPENFTKWNRQAVLNLKKRAFGNFIDVELFKKLARLDDHLSNYDGFFFSYKRKREWEEVERLADEVTELLTRLKSS